jgi:hypothetical protein
MKTCLIALFMMISISALNAGEVTGAGAVVDRVLQKSGISVSNLRARGLKVRRANNRVHLNDIHSIITNRNVVRYNNIGHVEFKNPSAAATLGDVIHFELGRGTISKRQVQAVITR